MCGKLKKVIMWMLVFAWLLLPASVRAADSGAGTMRDSRYTVIAPGYEYYARSYGEDDGMRQKGFSLEVSANSDVYPIVMACDTIWGGMTMDTIVDYAGQQGYNVVGAVNTAFFNDAAVPIGIVVENGILKSSADGLNAFAIMEDGTYYLSEDPKLSFVLNNAAWGSEIYEIDHLNKLFSPQELHLYSSAYSTVSTRVEDETVWAVRMLVNEGELTLNGTVTLTVTEVLSEAQAVPIGDEYMVLTASVEGPYGELWQHFAVGDRITIQTICSDEQLARARYVTGCGDILVEEGKLADSTDWMHYIGGHNPRTLVGWRADGTLVLYVAEGRNPGTADGLTLHMAAEEMLRQGCVYAVNMDGGGSSIIGARLPGQMSVQMLNSPAAGAQRQSACYLLLVTDKPADGIAKYWHLNQNHLTVLPGQHVYLSVFGTDAALLPAVNQPQQLLYADGQGLLDGNLFIAPRTSGTHRLTMWGTGAFGEGTIRVVANPTVLKITDRQGRVPTTITLGRGEKPDLKVVAVHNGEVIPTDTTVISYEMSVPLGYVDANGVFTADAPHGTVGTLTMRIGDYSQQLQVKVVNSHTDILQNRIKTALDRFQSVW